MRKTRVIEHCRCYHLVSRLAHRAFFLDDGEKTRAVELLRRDEEISRCIDAPYREAVGIRSRIHFNRYYLAPLQEKGLIVRTDPDQPNSPRQKYALIPQIPLCIRVIDIRKSPDRWDWKP